MRRLAATVSLLLVAGLLLGCGDDEASPSPPAESAGAEPPETTGASSPEREEASPANAPSRPAGTEIVVSDSQYGPILFGPGRQAIYLFDKEAGPKSECYGACAEAWPPVLTEDAPKAGSGADAKLLGTTERDDGSVQVTYDGRPLYYYVDDPPGEVLCHNVAEFGGLWLVLRADGQPVA